MKYLVANFKANLTEKEISEWIEEFARYQLSAIPGLASAQPRAGSHQPSAIVICPSFVHLDLFRNSNLKNKVKLGTQDLSVYPQGAYTGEVTAKMLSELGVAYAILGHSERRRLFKETNKEVLKKAKQALKYKITPIICVDKNNFRSQIKLISYQLSAISYQLLYAYEPPSAIGTGRPEKPEAVEKTARKIKKLSNRPVLYGGSVSSQNAAAFLRQPSIDGLLISTASLKVKTFLEILNLSNE